MLTLSAAPPTNAGIHKHVAVESRRHNAASAAAAAASRRQMAGVHATQSLYDHMFDAPKGGFGSSDMSEQVTAGSALPDEA